MVISSQHQISQSTLIPKTHQWIIQKGLMAEPSIEASSARWRWIRSRKRRTPDWDWWRTGGTGLAWAINILFSPKPCCNTIFVFDTLSVVDPSIIASRPLAAPSVKYGIAVFESWINEFSQAHFHTVFIEAEGVDSSFWSPIIIEVLFNLPDERRMIPFENWNNFAWNITEMIMNEANKSLQNPKGYALA